MIARAESERMMLRESGRRLAAVMAMLVAAVRPGVSTHDLDALAESEIRASGGDPIFKGYRDEPGARRFPASICVSINDEVVHGIPRRDRKLREGDVVSIDIGLRYPASGGLVTDMAETVPVGSASPEDARLIAATREALERGIAALRAGARLGDVGFAIHSALASEGFGVVRELVGHGVGLELHEDPYVPNVGAPGEGMTIPDGMVLAVEPMATLGRAAVARGRDGWVWRTRDGSRAAHFEHTVLVSGDGAEVLTRR